MRLITYAGCEYPYNQRLKIKVILTKFDNTVCKIRSVIRPISILHAEEVTGTKLSTMFWNYLFRGVILMSLSFFISLAN
jgi:hypothetical protein